MSLNINYYYYFLKAWDETSTLLHKIKEKIPREAEGDNLYKPGNDFRKRQG